MHNYNNNLGGMEKFKNIINSNESLVVKLVVRWINWKIISPMAKLERWKLFKTP